MEDGERAPKRISGWQIERELAEPSTPCPKEDGEGSSALCTRLLELRAPVSCVAAELAHLAIIDGASSPELLRLAKCGNFGQNPEI